MMKFTAKGVFSVSFAGYKNGGGYLLLRCGGFCVDSRDCKWVKKNNVFVTDIVFGNKKLRLQIKIESSSVMIDVANGGKIDVQIETIELVLDRLIESRRYWQYVHHNPVVFDCGVRTVALKSELIKFDDRSETVTVFVEKDTNKALLLGANSIAQATTSFELIPESSDWDSRFAVKVCFDFHCVLRAEETISTPVLLMLAGDNGLELLDEYGRAWRKRFRNRRKDRIVGWNSWDYYAGAIREEDIITNAKEFKKIAGSKDGYIVIDDGWQVRWGDWGEANYYFPNGLKGLVKKIKDLGVKAGIWTAPYTAHAYSMIVREHPEALLRNEKGEFVIEQFSCGSVYVLDPMHPVTRKYISDIFSRLRDIGFEYFKIDFTFAIEKGRSFCDGRGLQHALRESIAIIRKAIGQNAYLMSGCYSIESAGGYVDAARVCADIHNFWGHIRRNAIEVSGRFWTGHIWNNDPDFLIVRSKQTSDDVRFNRPANPNPAGNLWFGGRILDVDEVITWASIVMLAGGDVILSDNLSTLNTRGREIIETVLENALEFPAYPIDLFSDEEIPSIWVGQPDDGYLVGVFNWTESQQSYEFEPEACDIDMSRIKAITDIWTGEKILCNSSGLIEFELKAHQCRVMKFYI